MSSAEALCPLCNRPNHCGAAAGATRCWCFDLAVPPALLSQLPATRRGTACICRNCIVAFQRQATTGTNPVPGGPSQ